MTLTLRRRDSARKTDASGSGTARRLFSGRWADITVWVAVCCLAVSSVGIAVKGVSTAWATGADTTARSRAGDLDMREREAEYRCFRKGVYPNFRLAGSKRPAWLRHTPYPPYALPMFAIFFEPGGVLQGRVLIELLSAASLVLMGVYGYRQLRFAGPAMASIGAVAAAAITGNSTAIELGHFSIICAGLIVAQMMLLESGRRLPAGICWALAMIKPQIALAFVPLFMANRQWRGLLVGCSLLGLSWLSSCWWTNVPPTAAISEWFLGLSWVFATHAQGIGPGALAAWLGIDPLSMHAAMIVTCGFLLAAVCWLLLRRTAGDRGLTFRMAPLAGVCAVLGEVFVYHHHYDNVMLFPALIAILTLAAQVPAWWSAGLATAMAATLWIPQRLIAQIPFNGAGRAAIWLTVAAVLMLFVADTVSPARRAWSIPGGRWMGRWKWWS